jgi:hypothetical protein
MENLEKEQTEAEKIAEIIINSKNTKKDFFDGGSETSPEEEIFNACNGDVELCEQVYDIIMLRH